MAILVREICGTSNNDQVGTVATPQLLNSVVNVDDVMQKIGSHLRLRFERFDYDLNRVTICEGCNYCKRRP